MQKRGQITLVLILVVFIIIILCVVFYISSTIRSGSGQSATYKAVATPLDVTPIQIYMDSLVAEATKSGLEVLGGHGGYISQQQNKSFGEAGYKEYTNYSRAAIPLLIIDRDKDGIIENDENYSLPLKNITERLRRYLVIQIANVSNFSSLEDRGYVVNAPNISYAEIDFDFSMANPGYSSYKVNVTVSADDRDTAIELQYPILVSKRDSRTELLHFKSMVYIPLKSISSNVTNLVSEIAKQQIYTFDLAACAKYSAVRNIYVTELQHYVYVVRFIANISQSYNYTFQFALRNVTVDGKCPA